MSQRLPETQAMLDFKKLLSRRLPVRGPSGLTLFVGAFAFIGFGLYRVTKAKHTELLLEEEQDRLYLQIFPALAAMDDRKLLRRERDWAKKEAEIMKDVPGWVVGEKFYKTRWVCDSLYYGSIDIT